MKIENHLLTGDNIALRETPNHGGSIAPEFLVFHFTAGRDAESSVKWLCDPRAKASAHIVIARDGTITQLAPFNIETWHAGISHWKGLSGLNSHSIAIEMDNAGRLTQVGSGEYKAWFQRIYPESEVLFAKHKLESEPAFWHTFTTAQIERATLLAEELVAAYDLKDIIGHDDIAPDRKRDPGPAFPLENIRSRILGRQEETEELYEVTAAFLNIRKGPGVEFGKVSDALPAGTVVALLETRNRWSKIDVQQDNDIEGWVFNKYLKAVVD